MNRHELAAQALAVWTIDALKKGKKSLARQDLPEIDVQTFLKAFANESGFPSAISLSLVGVGLDSSGLRKLALRNKASCFAHFATDLHEAANWRNHRSQHPLIVAYARGSVSGVNTLRHFIMPSSRELTLALLQWALSVPEFTLTPAHARLLVEVSGLASDDIFSFEQVTAFLESWSSQKGTGAPRGALVALGLFPDPNLFADGTLIRQRLEQNLTVMETLRDRSAGQMEACRKRVANADGAAALLKIFANLLLVRRHPSPLNLSKLDLDSALKIFAPSKNTKPGSKAKPEEPPVLNEKKLQQSSAEALLENRESELIENADALSQGLRNVLDAGEISSEDESWECEVKSNGEQVPFKGHLDLKFVGWVRHFCREDVWGGLIETPLADLQRGLADFDRPGTLLLNPEAFLKGTNRELGITKLLKGWDEELGSLGFIRLWDEYRVLRKELLTSLEELTHFPLEWFAGKSEVTETAKRYLSSAGKLFGLVSEKYGAMAQADQSWADTTLEGLMALDVVQVRVTQTDGRTASKAVLLPTHPLHLWRYLRLSQILRGLGKDIDEEDKAAILADLSEPIQFLTVIYASPLPNGRGAGQILPVANDIHRLATFENLDNAYRGSDGQVALVKAVERFASAHPNHTSPLRVVLVNPPQAGSFLLDLLKLMDEGRGNFLKQVRVEVRGTPRLKERLRETLLFDTREREIIEEKIAGGRLFLSINRTPTPIDEIIRELKSAPAHIFAVFDEANVNVRRGGAGERLPMSPFCIRRRVAFLKRWNELRLEPTAGDPPFFQFIELVKQIEGNKGEGTPYAWPEAESLRNAIDSAVMGDDFGAQWFFLADRALPDEAGMQAQRLLRRREGQRQILLASRDYESLARLILPVFAEDTPNLLIPAMRLKELMAEGTHLVGAGLLDLVKTQQGRVDAHKVIGLMGTLLAARNYLRRYPEALLVSTDSQLARTWLRLGIQGERCDLLGLREERGVLVVEPIEAKSTKGKPRGEHELEIQKATVQVAATLSIIRDAFGDPAKAERAGRYLAAPRNEMLKEVLVHGCMGRTATDEHRKLWAGWLQRLFGENPEIPKSQGIVVEVAFGSSEKRKPQDVEAAGQVIHLIHLNEIDVQRLLEPERLDGDEGGLAKSEKNSPSPQRPVAGCAIQRDSRAEVSRIKTATGGTKPEPVAQEESLTPEQSIRFGVTKSGEPVDWSISIRGNPHLMMVGLPGMGKTTCLVNITKQLVARGVVPIVFSFHDDIDEKLASAIPRLKLADCRNLGFNPMRVSESDSQAHLETAGQLRDIFAAIFPDLGDLQRETLRSSIKESYEAKGWNKQNGTRRLPAFNDFLDRLRRVSKPDAGTKSLIARLDELDDYGFFKAGNESPSLLESAVPVVLQIHKTKNDAVQRAYAAFAFYRLYQDMFTRGRQEGLTHAIIFDEAHRASRLKLIPTMAKECRKFGISLVVASQESKDFDSSLFTAVANYLVLRVTEETAKHLAKNVAPSDKQRIIIDRIKSLPKFEAVWFTESRTSPLVLKLCE